MSRKNADGSGTLDVAQAREVLTDMGEEVDDAALVDTISTIGDGARDTVAQEDLLKWWRQHNQDALRGALESPEAREAFQRGELETVLFADDTLLVSSTSKHLEELTAAVETRGAEYGLELHWG